MEKICANDSQQGVTLQRIQTAHIIQQQKIRTQSGKKKMSRSPRLLSFYWMLGAGALG